MAKARHVIGDQNSLELDTLRRSYNSLLLVLEQLAIEVDASTLTATQAFSALKNVLGTGQDTSAPTNAAAHVGTGRQVYGIDPTPLHPSRKKEDVAQLHSMTVAAKY